MVTTLSRPTPGRGPVVVETLKGGVGVSSITFTFVGTEAGQVLGTVHGLVGGLWNTVESYSPFVHKKKGKTGERKGGGAREIRSLGGASETGRAEGWLWVYTSANSAVFDRSSD